MVTAPICALPRMLSRGHTCTYLRPRNNFQTFFISRHGEHTDAAGLLPLVYTSFFFFF